MKTPPDPVKLLAQRVRNDPNDLFSRFALALELLKRDEAGKAKAVFQSILAQDPSVQGVYYHLGKTLERLGELDGAMRAYKEGVLRADAGSDLHAKRELLEAIAMLRMEMDSELEMDSEMDSEMAGSSEMEMDSELAGSSEVKSAQVERSEMESDEIKRSEIKSNEEGRVQADSSDKQFRL